LATVFATALTVGFVFDLVGRHWTRRGRATLAAGAALATVFVASRALLGVHWLTTSSPV